MDRAIPTASRVLDKKWRDQRDMKERQRLAKLKPRIDNSPPQKYPFISRFTGGHVSYQDHENARQVNKENLRIDKKITHISKGIGEYSQAKMLVQSRPICYCDANSEGGSPMNAVKRRLKEEQEVTEAWLAALQSPNPEKVARKAKISANPTRRVPVPNTKPTHSIARLEEEYFNTRAPAMLMCSEKPVLQSIQEYSDFRSEIMHEYSRNESMRAIQSMSSPGKSPIKLIYKSPKRSITRTMMSGSAKPVRCSTRIADSSTSHYTTDTILPSLPKRSSKTPKPLVPGPGGSSLTCLDRQKASAPFTKLATPSSQVSVYNAPSFSELYMSTRAKGSSRLESQLSAAGDELSRDNESTCEVSYARGVSQVDVSQSHE